MGLCDGPRSRIFALPVAVRADHIFEIPRADWAN
jgi:hypothetical protein